LLMIQGLRPGPSLLREQMPFVYTIIIAAIISQVVMLVASTYFGFSFTSLLGIPTQILAPVLAVFCIAGVFAVRNAAFDIRLMLAFGILGWLMKRYNFPVSAIVLGIVLGGIADNELIRTSMRYGAGFYTQFLTRPISLILLALIILGIAYPYIPKLFKRDSEAGTESE